MTDENTTQEQANETQADKFTWRPEDVQITPPAENTTPQDQEPEVEMEQAEDEPKRAVHHATKRGADMSLAKREISQESHKAVLEGLITLAEAKELGRTQGPDGPVDQSTKKVSTPKKDKPVALCLACGEPTKGGRFHPGCDMKMYRVAREALDGERELTPDQREYLETLGKMAQVVAKREKDEAKRQEKIAAKAEAQRKREGEAEAKKRNVTD